LPAPQDSGRKSAGSDVAYRFRHTQLSTERREPNSPPSIAIPILEPRTTFPSMRLPASWKRVG